MFAKRCPFSWAIYDHDSITLVADRMNPAWDELGLILKNFLLRVSKYFPWYSYFALLEYWKSLIIPDNILGLHSNNLPIFQTKFRDKDLTFGLEFD